MAEYNSTSSGYPLTATIDPVNDVWLIWTNSVMAVQSINRNVALGLASGPVGLTDVQTLTNKTLTAPTISSPVLSGTATGTYTLGGTPTFPASVATLTGAQVLTNKTLTSPTINSPSITNATLTTDAVTGYTTSNSGVVYGGLTMTTGNAAFSGNATVGGTLGVTGVATFTANPVLPNASIPGNELVGVNLWGVANSINSSPPARLTGQFYMQAGYSTVTLDGNNSGTITYPTAFPHGTLTVLIMPTTNVLVTYVTGYTGSTSASQFGLVCASGATDVVNFNWIAIGF